MKCPICKSTMGFVCGTCIECGFNHYDNEYRFITISTDVLRSIVSMDMFDYLVKEHERCKKIK